MTNASRVTEPADPRASRERARPPRDGERMPTPKPQLEAARHQPGEGDSRHASRARATLRPGPESAPRASSGSDVRIERQRDVTAVALQDGSHLQTVRVRDGHERRPGSLGQRVSEAFHGDDLSPHGHAVHLVTARPPVRRASRPVQRRTVRVAPDRDEPRELRFGADVRDPPTLEELQAAYVAVSGCAGVMRRIGRASRRAGGRRMEASAG